MYMTNISSGNGMKVNFGFIQSYIRQYETKNNTPGSYNLEVLLFTFYRG